MEEESANSCVFMQFYTFHSKEIFPRETDILPSLVSRHPNKQATRKSVGDAEPSVLARDGSQSWFRLFCSFAHMVQTLVIKEMGWALRPLLLDPVTWALRPCRKEPNAPGATETLQIQLPAAFKNTNSTETEGQEEANRMRCNIFKMSVLAKLIYKFKTIPIKIPAAGFCKNGQIPYANFNMKMQGTLGGQNNLVKRRTKLRTHISQFQKLLWNYSNQESVIPT